MRVLKWLRGRKITASVVAASVVVAVPVTFAVLHHGFPVTDVDLVAKDVWVTNGSELMAGRLNRQIEELDGSVASVSNDIDVLQNGDNVLLHDRSSSTLERVDPAFTTLIERAELPPGSEAALGGTRLAVIDPDDGALWLTDIGAGLRFSTADNEPLAELGSGAQAAVSAEGTVFAVSPSEKRMYAYAPEGGEPAVTTLPELGDYQLTVAGDTPVILDLEQNTLVVDGGRFDELPEPALKIQQVSATPGEVVVASGTSLLRVELASGDVETIDAGLSQPVTKPIEVSSPVNLNGCLHGAWSGASAYVARCDGNEVQTQKIEPLARGSILEFRVNRDVIALNNLQTGDVWLVDADMRLVKNWEEVTPPQEDEGEEGDEKASTQSFEDTLADRTETNRPPLARDDELGARPGRTTVLPILDNDTDPDGDVLTIGNIEGFAEASGTLEYIDGSRALQFTPNPTQSAGTVSFRYSVSDGRTAGVDSATVSVLIQPPDANNPPVGQREGAVVVEAGQSVTYNPLIDWRDPDGDDVFLVSAASDAGDLVRFSPDGFVTVTHTSAQQGPRDVVFVVSDGTETATGTFVVDVKPNGSQNPVGTPDHIETFVGEPVSALPLDNDMSPSGDQLELLGAEALSGGLSTTPNTDKGTIQVNAGVAGVYYVQYTLGAGPKTSIGLLRVDVKDHPDDALAPVAVRDTGYLRPNEPTTLNVLTNDASPSGEVLAIQKVDVPDDARVLSIEVLNSSVIRVTASAAITAQLQFSYTVSDGVNTAETTVAIVPVPPLVKHQAPIAEDDQVTVRAGDVASVAVLENDQHPDGATMALDPRLVEEPQAGLAFVTDDRLRYQAPAEPGTYSVVYTVTDDFEQSDVGQVTFTVVAPDIETNNEPAPRTLTARVFADSHVTVNVPLDGIDPDGDSVIFDGLESTPSLGLVSESTSVSFTYEAAPGSAGTDTFSYRVKDVYGAVSTGVVRIGVIQRPEQTSPPIAVDDTIEVQPGRVASVDVLANDSDPNGYEIALDEKLPEVPEGIEANADGRLVEVEAPDEETTFSIRYEIGNGHGGSDTAFIQVRVTPDATLQPPTVIDHIVEPDEIVGKKTVDIDVREGANNPGGRVGDLAVSVEGPNASQAEVLDDGRVRVTLAETRTAIAYSLTNEIDDLSSAAFIVVPPLTADGAEESEPPRLIPGLGEQVVDMNGTISWNLTDIAESPIGNDIALTGAAGVSATRSDGTPNYVNDQRLTFTPAPDYRGPATITFEVSDGTPHGVALLTLPVTVGDADMEDVPPTFTPPEITIEAGEEPATLDLRASTAHPNPAVLEQVRYANLSGQGSGVEASLSGSTLTASAPFGTQPGTVATLTFTVSFKEFDIEGSAVVRVVSSTRPLPSTVEDVEPDARSSKAVTMSVLENDYNPFPGEPLTIEEAVIDSGNATVTISGENLVVTPGPDKSQEISVVYTVMDATNDPNRQAQGRARVVVMSAPDAPPAPDLSTQDGKILVTINPSAASNGAPISSYTVYRNDGVEQSGAAGAVLTFSGQNGVSYTFTVTATNKVGESSRSAGASATSYGAPGKPKAVAIAQPGDAPTTLSASWQPPDNDGGSITRYEWRFHSGAGSGSGTALSARSNEVGSGDYTVEVQACGEGGCSGWQSSPAVHVSDPPPPPPTVTYVGPYGGPATYCDGPRCVSNAHKVEFRYENWGGARTEQVTPQFCRDGQWQDMAPTRPHDMGGNGTVKMTAFMQAGYSCGVRVKIGSYTSPSFPWP
ncbi:Ig-like domain-containing protein [Okibacterium endophyticum]